MAFEIFLDKVTCEATLGSTGTQILRPGTEKLARPHIRHSSRRRLIKVFGSRS
jgi:hypothetical protein